MTRKWVTYDAIDYISVKFHGAIGDGVADDTAAVQAAIDEACGAGSPAITTRTANRRVLIPQGIYRVTSPLTVQSVIGFELAATGYVEIRAGANMTSVFDINGAAYSKFGGFTITGSGGVQVDNALYTYWESADALRSNTLNSYHDIVIRNLDFISGIRIGKPSEGSQVDNDEWRHITVAGAWSATSGASATRYQDGIHWGDSVAANNLAHRGYDIAVAHCRYPHLIDNTQVLIAGGSVDGCETAFKCQSSGYIKITGLDIEDAQRLFTSAASGANTNVSLENIYFRANSLNADGKWIDHNMGGTLTLRDTACNLAAVTPLIKTGSNPLRVHVDGLSVRASGDPARSAWFSLGGSTVVRGEGLARVAYSGGLVIDVDDYASDGAGPVQADVYTSGTSTWTKPAWAVRVHIACLGGGGGGGGGREGAAGTVRCGGGGGGGGAWSEIEYDAADLPSQLSASVGAAGTAGAAATANDTDGGNGGAGGSTFVRDTGLTVVYCRANGGGAGGGGTNAAGTGGGAALGQFGSGAGGAASTTGLVGAAGSSASAAGGGGSGGGITTGDAASAGGAAGLSNTRASSNAPGGGAVGTNGQSSNGAPTPAGSTFPGHGGGGGGSSITGVAGSGGAGAEAGGGGGGGGASLNGNNSGAGGAGAVGRIVITSYGA